MLLSVAIPMRSMLLLLTRPAGWQRCMLHAAYWQPCRGPLLLLLIQLLLVIRLLPLLLAHWLT
jgi:hypothetical protein